MIIYSPTGETLLDVMPDDNSYRHRAMMGDNSLTLYFSLPQHVEIPVGAYCEHDDERYTLMHPESLKMHHTRHFEYTVELVAEQGKMSIWKFRNTVDGRLRFSLTAKPHEHLQMLVDNLNRRDSGWTLGTCIDSPERVVNYDHAFCRDALAMIAKEFGTEYEIVGKRISLGAVEHDRANALPLSYGKGNGFVSGVARTNGEDSVPTEILYVQGGERNIDRSKYGASTLHLPVNAAIAYDGAHFEGETGYDAARARRYRTDEKGFSVQRADRPLSSMAEDSVDLTDIYPSRVGTVGEVITANEKNHFYDFTDPTIPETLDFEQCLIAGEKMTVIFQSGMLSGREFEVKYAHAASGKKARRFEIVPQEIDGMTMPGGVFVPRVGDKYAVFHCMLPQAYINDTATRSGAEWDLLRKAVKHLYSHEDPKFSFTGTLDGIWAKRNWENVGGRLKIGAFILFSDKQFQPEGVAVRIVGIKDYINTPHSPEIELSNAPVAVSFSTTLKTLESAAVAVEEKHREALQYSDRRFRDAKKLVERARVAEEAETLRTPNYSDGLNTGAGARIDAMGNAEFQSMAVRGFFRAAEYQINRIALSEGDVFHTENGLVKSATRQADGRWKVVLQERFQGDVTGFRAGDILRGAYNGIGTSGGAAEIRTSWLRVEAVDAKAGTLTASLYADNQTPEGRNAPPIALMRLARWGNTTDPERQSHIVESATDGRIVRRVKVSAPIVDGAQSDGFVVGKLPAWLREHFGAAVADASDYVFARGIITQNILRYTPAGRPLAERVDRGLWNASARYFYEQQNPETGAFEISRVWHDGALYELARGGNGNTVPAAQSTHWTLIQAKPKDGDKGVPGKDAPATGANLIDGTSFRNMEDVRNWKDFERFAFNQSQEDKVHPLAQAVGAHKNETWIQGILYIASLLRPNTTYTLSVYSKGAPGKLIFWFLSNATNRDTLCANLDPKKWTRYAYTFTTPDAIPDGVRIMLRCMDHDAKTYFSALKLEEGETATPWCLSENDKMATPAANPNLWHCTDYVTRPHFTKGYLDGKTYASILPGGVDGDNYFHVEGSGEERYTHVWWEKFGDLYPRGTWYTFSFKCRGSGNAFFGCYPMHGKQQYFFPRIKRNGVLQVWGKQLVLSIPLTGTWTTYSLSVFYDAPEDDLPKTLWTFFKLLKSEGNYLDICHPKMETGEFATPWCLSEMDKKGDPGKSSYTHVAYSNSPNGNPCTLDPKGEKFAYLGTYTDENPAASPDPARYVWAKVQGDKGDKGDKGRGIERVEAFYRLTEKNTAPSLRESGWTNTAPQPTKEWPWLWHCELTEYTNGDTTETAVRLIGHYGKDGTNGTSIRAQYSADAQTWHDDFAGGDVWMRTGNGTTWGSALRVVGESGTDGKSPVYDFAASSQLATASGTTAPTIRGTWQDAPPTLREGEVLWYRLTAANGKITYGRLSGEKGKPGKEGKTSYTHIAYANSDDGEKDFTREEDLGRGGEIEFSYFGIYADFDERASQDYHDYVWTRLRGVDGKDGLTPNANLLDDTDFKNLGRKESAWKIGTHGEEPVAGRANISIFSSAVDGCVPALCAINPGTKEGEFAQLFQNVGQLIPGRTYTFSAYVRGADVAWLIVYPTPAEHFHPNTVKPDGWTRVSLTFRAPAVQDPDGVMLLLRAWHRETTPHTGYAKSVAWCAPKLEEGEGPTQWCPSFRDQRGADGSPGARGAAVRLLGDYAQLADGTAFESGHAGEQYVDVVQVRQGEQVQFYQCKQPHTKSADKAPAADSEWWGLGMYQGFIATDLLLARRSLIKNLQVENVVGRDERGNATFELDAATGTAYIGGTATFAGFIRRRPVVITPENWKEYGGEMGRSGDVFYLNPFAVGTYVIFRGDFGALRPTIDTSNDPLGEGRAELTEDNSHLMRYYGAQFMVFNDTPTSLFIGGVKIDKKGTAVFTMLGRNRENPTLWWKGEIVGRW